MTFNATVELKATTTAGGGAIANPTPFPLPQASGATPRFQIFTPPQSILNAAGKGTDAGEPSIGVNWKTGNILFQSDLTTFRVAFDDSCPTSPLATWLDKSAPNNATSLDPIMYTDHGYNNQTPDTGRTFPSQLAGGTSLGAYTDDDGETYIPVQAVLTSGVDHQSIGGGGPFHTLTGGLQFAGNTYPHPVYYCSQGIADASCAMSTDGGLHFGPAVPIYALTACGGLSRAR